MTVDVLRGVLAPVNNLQQPTSKMRLNLVSTCEPVHRPSAVLAGLFLRACWATVLQGLGVVAFARGSYWACVTAFTIQYVWAGNSRAVNDQRPRGGALAYGMGGAVGAAIVLWIALHKDTAALFLARIIAYVV